MSQIKALIMKEFRTQKNAILMPFYIQGGIYLMMLLVFILAYFKGEADIQLLNTEIGKISTGIHNIYFWLAGAMLTVIPAFLTVITYTSVSVSTVNDDYKNKCVLFYSTMPVNFIKKILTKIGFVVSITSISIIILSLINIGINAIIASFFIKIHLGYILLGFVQNFIIIFFSMLLIHSICWFFAAIFKNKTTSYAILSYIVYKIIISLSALIFGNNLMRYLNVVEKYIFNLVIPRFSINFDNLGYEPYAKDIIVTNWNNIFSSETIEKLVLSVVLFTIAAFIIQRREIE